MVIHAMQGPALRTAWSKVLPLTASGLSPLPGYEFRQGHVRKLPVTLDIGGGFRRGTMVSSTSYNWLVTN